MKYYALAFLFFVSLSFGQKLDFKFDKITTRDGLNQNTVTTILQNQQGYLWFGTPNGITRYDGYSFRVYKNLNNKDDLSISNNITVTIEDYDGNIWIGTAQDGLYVLSYKSGKFEQVEAYKENVGAIRAIFTDTRNNTWVGTAKDGIRKYSPEFKLLEHYKQSKHGNSIKSNNISAILEDNNQNIWIASDDAGLNMLNNDSKNISDIDLKTKDIRITALSIDKYGMLWIGTKKKGVICFDTNSGFLSVNDLDINNKCNLVNNTINIIYRDSQDRFWIGTDNGLSLIDPDNESFHNFYRDPSDPLSLSGNQILSILEDRSGIIWIGTKRNGLNRINRSFADFNNFYRNTQDENTLPSDVIWDFYPAQFGNLWIGTDNGLTYWDKNRNKFNTYQAKAHSLNNKVVRVIEKMNDEKLILGTDGGGLNIFNTKSGKWSYFTSTKNPASLSDNRVRDILNNDDGTYWIATMDGLNLFNPKDASFKRFKHIEGDISTLSDNRILDLEKDNEGNLWLATYNGLSVYLAELKEFKNYYHDSKNQQSISHNECNILYFSENDPGVIWVGTENGLNKFDIRTETATLFLQEDHENNVLYSITEDNEGLLWIGTKKGISRFNRKNETFKNFDQNDGIRNYEFNVSASLVHSDGSLYFGGLSGITTFKPSDMKKNDIIPNIAITAFKKYGEVFPIDSILTSNGVLHLEHDDKFISIEFAAMDYTNSSKNQFRYMLEGFDENWINAGQKRSASYTNLGGGDYTFYVIGSNNDGVWNESGAKLRITVHPAFWKTWWFQVLLLISVFLLVYALYRNRIAFMKRQRHELQKEVSVQTRELYKSNMNLQNIMSQNASILENVEEGFFILDNQLVIQSQFSAALLDIFEMDSPAGLKLISLLDTFLPEQDMSLVRDYLGFIFDHDLDEELIKDLNPFKRLEFIFKVNGKELSKYLTFKFKRIKRNKKVSSLIVTVIDDTKEIKLSQQLEQNEAKSKAQVDLLMGILHLDADMLNEFMTSTYVEITKIENLLQSQHKQDEYKGVLEQLLGSIIMLKENAINLDLKFFLQDVIEIENKTEFIQEKERLTGIDFLPIVLQYKELKAHLDELNNLVERIAKFSAQKNKQTIVLDEHANN